MPEDLTRYRLAAEKLLETDHTHVAGADEVGFGSCAGPLIIGGVGVPFGWKPPKDLTDSKKLSSRQIERLATDFLTEASTNPELACCVVWFDSATIDERGLGRCRSDGLITAIEKVKSKYPDLSRVLGITDGNLTLFGSKSIPKADKFVPAVSMAAVVAKHSHDQWMRKVAAKEYPGYGFEDHVGYDTAKHRAALEKLGPCAIHRKSNSTIQKYLKAEASDLFDLAMSGDLD